MKQKDMSSEVSSTKKTRAFGIVFLLLSGALVVYIAYPIANIVTLLEPRTFMESITRPQIGGTFLLSVGTATISSLLLAAFGIPFAYCMARYNFPGKFLLRVIIIIPLVIPPLASGTLLLGVFGPYTPIGRSLPVEFTQSAIGVIIAQTYVSSPFMILLALAAFESVDESYEKVSRILGKGRLETFLRVSLPLAKRGIMAGFIMTWVRSLGELGATMMMAYNPHTVSIQIFEDNAVGGIQNTLPVILLVILLSALVLGIFSTVKKEGLKLGW
ncbi:MAG TPA: ABC transporter permease [Nitrososphaeraceae archaeon]|nr:ABC transporter permease [Nitrososphaeraceae archaeon]